MLKHAVTRIRTWVIAATTQGTNHYTITAKLRTCWARRVSSFQYMYRQIKICQLLTTPLAVSWSSLTRRRLTRNQIPSGSVGSNPTDCARFFGMFFYVLEQSIPVFMNSLSSCGRVVKASDSKSDSLWERRFESYQLRCVFFGLSI